QYSKAVDHFSAKVSNRLRTRATFWVQYRTSQTPLIARALFGITSGLLASMPLRSPDFLQHVHQQHIWKSDPASPLCLRGTRSEQMDCEQRSFLWIPAPEPRSMRFVTKSSVALLKIATSRCSMLWPRGTCYFSTVRIGSLQIRMLPSFSSRSFRASI